MIAKNYDEIDWAYSQKKLAVLQHDILEAYKKKDSHRILITQNKLIRSFAARSLAVFGNFRTKVQKQRELAEFR